jgi:hypothetical protein
VELHVPDKRPIPRITIKRLTAWDACYEPGELAAVFGTRKTLSPFEICALDIPPADKLWVLLRPEIIPAEELHALGIKFVTAALPGPKVRARGVQAHRRRVQALLTAKRKWMRGKLSDDELRLRCREFERACLAAGDTDPVERYFLCRAASAAAETDPRRASYLAACDARCGWPPGKTARKCKPRARSVQQLARVRKVLARLYTEPSGAPRA